MASVLQQLRLREPVVRAFGRADAGGMGRRWRLTEAGLVADADAGSGGDVIAVPSEAVLVLALDLPLPSRRRRLEALPFAVEDHIADPLEAVHLALGSEIAPQRHLVGVVRHGVMRHWLALAEAAGVAGAALVPDALLLPRPAAGRWAVALADGRALVRRGDGTGFAIRASLLVAAWAADGRPPCVTYGAPLPDPIPSLPPDDAAGERDMPLDLRQGRYAARRQPVSALGRRVALVAAAGIVAHAAIAAADTIALSSIASRRQAETAALLAVTLPGVGPGEDLLSTVSARLPVAGATAAPDRFLPLLARVSAAIGRSGTVAMRGLRFDRGAGRLILDVDPGSEARLATALAATGIAASATPGRIIVTEAP